jgi:hypothetical protein
MSVWIFFEMSGMPYQMTSGAAVSQRRIDIAATPAAALENARIRPVCRSPKRD